MSGRVDEAIGVHHDKSRGVAKVFISKVVGQASHVFKAKKRAMAAAPRSAVFIVVDRAFVSGSGGDRWDGELGRRGSEEVAVASPSKLHLIGKGGLFALAGNGV